MSSEATDHLAYDIGVILHQANSTEPLYTIRDRIVVERIERAGGPIVLEPGEAEITNETVTLLRLLYARQAPDLQESFAAIVCRAMRTKDARASAATLILIERTRELMEALFRQTFGRNEEEDVSIRIAIWSGVSEVLSRDSHRLTAVDLAQAEVIRFYGESQVPGRSRLGSVLSHELHQVDEVLKLVRFQRLRSELVQGANPEINTDKLALVSGMEQLGFRTDIVDAIHQLDRKVYEAGKPLEFAECMRLARTIFEEIVEDAGRRAAALRKINYRLVVSRETSARGRTCSSKRTVSIGVKGYCFRRSTTISLIPALTD